MLYKQIFYNEDNYYCNHSTHGKLQAQKFHTKFQSENLKGQGYLGDLG